MRGFFVGMNYAYLTLLLCSSVPLLLVNAQDARDFNICSPDSEKRDAWQALVCHPEANQFAYLSQLAIRRPPPEVTILVPSDEAMEKFWPPQALRYLRKSGDIDLVHSFVSLHVIPDRVYTEATFPFDEVLPTLYSRDLNLKRKASWRTGMLGNVLTTFAARDRAWVAGPHATTPSDGEQAFNVACVEGETKALRRKSGTLLWLTNPLLPPEFGPNNVCAADSDCPADCCCRPLDRSAFGFDNCNCLVDDDLCQCIQACGPCPEPVDA
eukprot:TRINITY_DN87746_c0_g1_i1.p1 TRINITY_DN87746_c0_g1~~TRINITY_DN87746_c0_g1_i1.p1  ORF type:complete len:276 (-),score=9.26 TRINITY_DN87746_c0_g1_i1:84-887(-)